jgi:predicted NBD/HSP70 family sugar kinase
MQLQSIGQRSETVRRANLSSIVRALHTNGPMSRSQLVARTGLTRSTIRGLIGELAAAGLVAEERAAPAGLPGRPSPVVRVRSDGAVVLALEIAVETLAAAVVGLGGACVELLRVPRPNRRQSVEDVTADLADLAATVLARRPASEPLIGVGVTVVGIVRRSDGCVHMAPNLEWRDTPLGDHLAAALGLDVPIAIANDADLGGLVESLRGAGVGIDELLYMSGEFGIGGSVIVDGQPLTGVAGYAGEIGHMPVNPAGTPCRCGSIGCWETEIGGAALLRLAGRSPDGGPGAVDGLIAEAEAGSPTALAAFDGVGRWLGIGLAGLINIFNPRLVILGGVLGRTLPFVSRTMEAELDRRALAAPRRLVRVVPSSLGVDAPLLGAAELALEPLLSDPAAWIFPRRTIRATA